MSIFLVITILSRIIETSALCSSQQRGFAFIEFETLEQAQKAIDNLNGQKVCGYHNITVMIARNNRKSSNEMREQDKL